jgi:hypothetical protein
VNPAASNAATVPTWSSERITSFGAAGLVDEILIHLVPVLFGSGTCMFEDMGIGHRWLEVDEVVNRPLATHIRYRVVR